MLTSKLIFFVMSCIYALYVLFMS